MKTYKIVFTNTSDKLDFCLLDGSSFAEILEIAMDEIGVERILMIIDVTGKFIDSNGTVKE